MTALRNTLVDGSENRSTYQLVLFIGVFSLQCRLTYNRTSDWIMVSVEGSLVFIPRDNDRAWTQAYARAAWLRGRLVQPDFDFNLLPIVWMLY